MPHSTPKRLRMSSVPPGKTALAPCWKSAAVTSAPMLDQDEQDLRARVLKLERRVEVLATVVRLLIVLVRTCGFRLGHERVPEGEKKARVLRAIESARRTIQLRSVLRIVGLNGSRFHSWKRAGKTCDLEDRSSCPKCSPQQLTADEVIAMRDIATSQEYRHVPTGTLAMLTQRLGKVYASASTWYRFIKDCGWRRPRRRIHPGKPTEGIRAEKADEIWHIDTTVIRLLDGTKVYLQAVLDNFSRRILAWRLDAQLQPAATATLLLKAAAGMKESLESRAETPSVMVDGGIENFNHAVDELVESGILKRILAQIDLLFSNSLIEAFWRTMKHECRAGLPNRQAGAVQGFRRPVPRARSRPRVPCRQRLLLGRQRIVSILSAVGGELKNARIVQRTEVSIIRDQHGAARNQRGGGL